MSIAFEVFEKAKASGVVIATAESCTAGMVAAALTDIAGSSAIFDRGFVTYSNAAKEEMLGVLPETLTQFGAVSQEVAIEMVQGALDYSLATLAVSITGIAGPGGSEHKPEGRVCFAVARKDQAPRAETVEFGAIGREAVRASARDHALKLLLNA